MWHDWTNVGNYSITCTGYRMYSLHMTLDGMLLLLYSDYVYLVVLLLPIVICAVASYLYHTPFSFPPFFYFSFLFLLIFAVFFPFPLCSFPFPSFSPSSLLRQVMGMVFLLLSQLMVTDVPQEYLWYSKCESIGGINNISGTCSSSIFVNLTTSVGDTIPKYWTNAGIFMLATLFVSFSVLVLFFKPNYKRLEVELKAKEEERIRREGVGIANGRN